MNAERWTRDQYIAHLSLLGWHAVWYPDQPHWGRGIGGVGRVLWLRGAGVPAPDAMVMEYGTDPPSKRCDWGKLGYYYLEAFVRYLEANHDLRP
ncbi:hypothetical protein [Burkholderia sp. JKS000303]|uniref:hypothetical protein n=1 Tax=Burkholderia sp. JKS000303 TaxID=1938747 RepID=UPI000C00C70D|nr:hypothetical protein [Burkholderia sp. JKS000303]PFH12887.1 hypothetical protein BX604_7307 [Burkholderia sp. JKS000303]